MNIRNKSEADFEESDQAKKKKWVAPTTAEVIII